MIQYSRIALCWLALLVGPAIAAQAAEIVHDAEYYILEAQNGDRWAAEDTALDRKLTELRRKHGQPPNIIHIMWDDTAFGDVGIPAIQKVRGLNTPRINAMAQEGMLFTHMYTEVGCTPSRAAVATGRLAIRSGMYNIGMLLEMHGHAGEEVTLAEVLSARQATRLRSTANGTSETSRRATPTTRVSTRRSSPATTRSSRCGPARVRPATAPWGCMRTCCRRIPTSSMTPSSPRTGSRSPKPRRARRHSPGGATTPTRIT